MLRKWKKDAEDRALRDIATAAPGTYRRPVVVVELDDADRAFLQSLALPPEDDADAVLARMRPAAERDIAAFRNTKEWPAHTIALSLTLHGRDDRRYAITIEGLANGLGAAEVVNVVSPPGTGKTTTLVQLAGALLQGGRTVAVLVPLGEWSDRREDFFTFLTRRHAFGAFRPQHFMQPAYHGRLALLLDGWNELDPASRIAATRHLKALRRDYPLLGIVVGTRRHLLPLSGATVEIEALSEDQQLELARRAYEAYPAPVREGLLRRVAARLELPYRAHEYLSDAAVVDDGPIVEAALDPATPGSAARALSPSSVRRRSERLSIGSSRCARCIWVIATRGAARSVKPNVTNMGGCRMQSAARATIPSSRPCWNVPIRMIRCASISWPKSSPGTGAMTRGSAPTSRPRRGRRW